jgi:hypothetical protein
MSRVRSRSRTTPGRLHTDRCSGRSLPCTARTLWRSRRRTWCSLRPCTLRTHKEGGCRWVGGGLVVGWWWVDEGS